MGDLYSTHPGQRDGRGLSSDLWSDCPLKQMDFLKVGWGKTEDFMGPHDLTNHYTLTQATTGTFALVDEEGGVADLDSNSITDNQGAQVQYASTVGERWKPQASSKIWFETRLKVTDAATGPQLFAGLSEIDSTIIAAGVNSSANHIGWEITTDDLVLLFFGEKAGARNAALASPGTLVDGTYAKLGFRVTDLTKVEHYFNGAKLGTTVLSANIPIVELTPSFVCQSAGVTDPVLSIDWWACWQEKR